MIGNDIVDLADPDCADGARHPGFDARVFAPDERARIASAADPHRMRWILWAAKEAAYKAARRLDPATVFSPVRFEVRLDTALEGHVRHPGGALRVSVTVVGDCVQAVATLPDASPQRASQAAADAGGLEPGVAARDLAVRTVAHAIGVAPADLRVGRSGRIPHLAHRNGATTPLSLSHHGRFVGFAAPASGEAAP